MENKRITEQLIDMCHDNNFDDALIEVILSAFNASGNYVAHKTAEFLRNRNIDKSIIDEYIEYYKSL